MYDITGFIVIVFVVFSTIVSDNVFNDEVDDGEGENADNETDDGVEDGIFGFFGFARIAGRSHVLNATDDDEDNGDQARDSDNAVQNVDNDIGELARVAFVWAAGSRSNFSWNVFVIANGGVSSVSGRSDAET